MCYSLPKLLIGHTVSHYRILAHLGEGGMGVVYRALDTRLAREVALKFLPDHLAAHPASLDRFRREARAATRINHPHICTVHDIGEYEGKPFLVMELLEGETLKQRLASKRLAAADLLSWCGQIADGLEAAHNAGIVHRDIKPANLFVTNREQIKILDFGLARSRNDADTPAEVHDEHTPTLTDFHTVPGQAIGTIAYMSPEQARGEELDRRTDIFSLGIVMYQMATGGLPFDGATSAVVFDSILNLHPPSVLVRNPALPKGLDFIVNKALEKDRKLRYQSAADLLADLARLQRDSSGPVAVASKKTSWRPRLAISATVLAVATTASLIYLYKRGSFTRETPQRELIPVRVTSNGADAPIVGMALSSDGKYLAYSDAEGLHFRAMKTADSRLVPDSKGLNPWWWNADSSEVFCSRKLSGSQELAYAVSLFRDDLRELGSAVPSPSGRFVLSTENNRGEVKRLLDGKTVSLTREGSERHWISWSPDEKRMTIEYVIGQKISMAMFDWETGRWTPLVPEHNGYSTGDIAWLSNQRLVYATADQPMTSNLWQIDLDAATGQVSGVPRQITHWADLLVTRLGSAPAANRLGFVKTFYGSDVYWGEFQTQTARLSQLRQLTSQESFNLPVAWMSGGKEILFVSNRDAHYRFYRQQLSSKTAKAVGSAPESSSLATLTPDGDSILYGEYSSQDKKFRIRKRDVRSGADQIIFSSGSRLGLACSTASSGPCLLSQLQEKTEGIFLLDYKNGNVTKLFDLTQSIWNWDLSPDGTQMLVLPGLQPSNHIQMVSLKGVFGRDIKVAGASRIESAIFAASGKGFLCEDVQLASNRLLYVEPSGESHMLLEQPGQANVMAVPSPDGKRIAIAKSEQSSNIWMIDNP